MKLLVLLALSIATTTGASILGDQIPYEQAKRELNEKISCWEVSEKKEYTVSGPIYTLCRWEQDWPARKEIYVSGVEEEENLKMLELFDDEKSIMLAVCGLVNHPADDEEAGIITMTCYCKRSACNVPQELERVIHMNSRELPGIRRGIV